MKKTFTYEEVQFLYAVLRARIESPEGCQIPGTDIKCPYWDTTDADLAEGLPGSCTVKKGNRVCTKLELPLVNEDLILEVRQKKTEDYLKELNDDLQAQKSLLSQINQEMRNLNQTRQSVQEEVARIERRKDLILKGVDKDDPSDDPQ